jgi:hypothetical protein
MKKRRRNRRMVNLRRLRRRLLVCRVTALRA